MPERFEQWQAAQRAARATRIAAAKPLTEPDEIERLAAWSDLYDCHTTAATLRHLLRLAYGKNDK